MNYLKQNGKYRNTITVEYMSDLPLPIGETINIPSNTTLIFPTNFNLGDYRLVCDHNVTIIGSSSETSVLSNTLVGFPLITSLGSLRLRDISFSTVSGSTIFDVNGAGISTAALDWLGVNILDSVIGVVKNVTNFVALGCAFLNSKGFIFDGTIGSIVFETSIFSAINSGTYIVIPDTANITRRIRVENCPIVVLPGAVGLSVSPLATINIESYIVKFGTFSGGGTYLSGVQPEDNKGLFFENRGVNNSASLSEYYVIDNLLSTTIVTPGTFVKINTNTIPGVFSQKFSLTNNRATYTGAVTRYFRLTSVFSASAGSNHIILGKFAKNGVLIDSSQGKATTSGGNRAENIKCQTIVALSPGDYIEAWVTNATNTTSVVVSDLNVIIEALN